MALATSTIGDGDVPVVAVHGFLGMGRNLTTLARKLTQLEPRLQVILPDLTGHGASPPLPEGADLDTLGADLLALVRDVGGGRPVGALGHSLGGRALLAAARQDSSLFAAITLLDISPSPITVPGADSTLIVTALASGPERAATREPFRDHLRAAGIAEALVEWQLLNLVQEGGEFRWRIDGAALARLQPRMNGVDLWPAVEGAPYRLHEIRGGRSGYVSDADAARLERAGCPVDTLAGVGHFVHVEGLPGLLEAVARRAPWSV
jgi:esterase